VEWNREEALRASGFALKKLQTKIFLVQEGLPFKLKDFIQSLRTYPSG
jgi:hypothetical protein